MTLLFIMVALIIFMSLEDFVGLMPIGGPFTYRFKLNIIASSNINKMITGEIIRMNHIHI
ncbi:hypothetical protein [Bacillus sp. 03113]|uniref:hypothetical protein n=1 Tax=Bacillus sp. 03113 TaxID=2578211 RepID=UPI0015E8A05E|nr:hypothetical protein [Bacillus sp. 03113]